MAAAQFRITRLLLVAGVKTPVTPPIVAQNVTIGNGTAGDLEVHTTDASNLEYLVIASQYERTIQLNRPRFSFESVALWLNSVAGGTVVIQWY
jgi:hypothetical protein